MSGTAHLGLGRWDTPFGRWVHETGVSRIVAALGRDPELSVTAPAVYMWIAGRHAPSPARAIALVRLSRGQITLDAIYEHRTQIRRPARGPAGSSEGGGGIQRR